MAKKARIGCCNLVYWGHRIVALNCAKGRGFVLPGGKMNDGETFRECALRELKEETNLDGLSPQLIFHGYNTDRYYVYTFLTQINNFNPVDSDEGKVELVTWEALLKSHFRAYYDILHQSEKHIMRGLGPSHLAHI